MSTKNFVRTTALLLQMFTSILQINILKKEKKY